ncbi:MAG: biotin--[acetyl-CoA-carboxylase] ligase [Firmicutes bacterium]|nr:biotin--[acetyl-CoA-carboxylase] ligase [Bacillota bacterium]
MSIIDDVRAAGDLLPPGFQMRFFEQLDSTNNAALDGDWPEFTVLAADSQRSGRGRLGRSWTSIPGRNLYVSIVLFPQRQTLEWGSLSLVTGVAVAKALAGLGFSPRLKWPNDVLLAGKKVAGVLCEARNAKLVAGIGLNVNQVEFADDLRHRATSLREQRGRGLSRSMVLAAVMNSFAGCYRLWQSAGFFALASQWSELDLLAGEFVRVAFGAKVVQGRARGIDEQGQLLVVDTAGKIRALNSGEVSIEYGY